MHALFHRVIDLCAKCRGESRVDSLRVIDLHAKFLTDTRDAIDNRFSLNVVKNSHRAQVTDKRVTGSSGRFPGPPACKGRTSGPHGTLPQRYKQPSPRSGVWEPGARHSACQQPDAPTVVRNLRAYIIYTLYVLFPPRIQLPFCVTAHNRRGLRIYRMVRSCIHVYAQS